MTTVTEAVDIMSGHATGAAAAASVAKITYTDVKPADLTGDEAWARLTIKHVGGGQLGFGDGTKKYGRGGIFCLELFTPPGDGNTLINDMAEKVLVYLENVRSSPVWYRNIRAADIGQDGGFQKVNIYAEFEYESNH